ncbi:MAG: hypothetical protein GY821_10075 [Gammaproteobacteria bacterium]|nr:hypothetical protein [Gammaproteobacteria bacterium]
MAANSALMKSKVDRIDRENQWLMKVARTMLGDDAPDASTGEIRERMKRFLGVGESSKKTPPSTVVEQFNDKCKTKKV